MRIPKSLWFFLAVLGLPIFSPAADDAFFAAEFSDSSAAVPASQNFDQIDSAAIYRAQITEMEATGWGIHRAGNNMLATGIPVAAAGGVIGYVGRLAMIFDGGSFDSESGECDDNSRIWGTIALVNGMAFLSGAGLIVSGIVLKIVGTRKIRAKELHRDLDRYEASEPLVSWQFAPTYDPVDHSAGVSLSLLF